MEEEQKYFWGVWSAGVVHFGLFMLCFGSLVNRIKIEIVSAEY